MERDRGGPSAGGGGRSPSGDVARIRQRLARMAPQNKALRLALSRYRDDAGGFDVKLWTQAFTCDRPETINEVIEVTGGYEGMVNHLMEMFQSGASLAGLAVARQRHKPSGPELIAAMKDDGCFTENQAAVLNNLNRTRNRLQHNSPGVPADEVHERIELLLKAMPHLLSSYVGWMEAHDIRLLSDEPS